MTGQTGDSPQPLIRVARGLSAASTMIFERHVFLNLDGQWALARCTHLSLTSELGEDDESVPMCPLCNVFLMADQLDVTQLNNDPDWKGM